MLEATSPGYTIAQYNEPTCWCVLIGMGCTRSVGGFPQLCTSSPYFCALHNTRIGKSCIQPLSFEPPSMVSVQKVPCPLPNLRRSTHHTTLNPAFAASHCAVGLLHCLVHRRSRSSLTHSIRRASTRFLPTRRIPTTCSFSLRMRGAYVSRGAYDGSLSPCLLHCRVRRNLAWLDCCPVVDWHRRAYMTFPLLEPNQQRLVDFVTKCAAHRRDLPTRYGYAWMHLLLLCSGGALILAGDRAGNSLRCSTRRSPFIPPA